MTELLRKQYTVQEELGRGRFGVVYGCKSNVDDTVYALKTIDKQRLLVSSSDTLDSQCLLYEPKVLHFLSPHPNIVSLSKTFEDSQHLHLLLDLFPFPDLHTFISLHGTFSEPDAVVIMQQLMQALRHCHQNGVAHRDVKPENVLVDGKSNAVKLVDFGSAEFFKEGEMSMSGLVGTPCYVAPEVVLGREYNEKVDVWSAGVVLYVTLSGILPFHGEDVKEIFESVVRGNLRFPVRAFKGVSSAAKDLLRRMLCRDVSRRFSADQVLRHPWTTSDGGSRDVENNY